MSETFIGEEDALEDVLQDFKIISTVQGRIAYAVMSVYIANPDLIPCLLRCDPYPYLYANMVYGMTVMIYNRPSMTPLAKFHRFTFSLLLSSMFNSSSIAVFESAASYINDSIKATMAGLILAGSMAYYFHGFLYHIDSRNRFVDYPKNQVFEYILYS